MFSHAHVRCEPYEMRSTLPFLPVHLRLVYDHSWGGLLLLAPAMSEGTDHRLLHRTLELVTADVIKLNSSQRQHLDVRSNLFPLHSTVEKWYHSCRVV